MEEISREIRKEIRDALLGRIRIENGNFTVAKKGLMQFQFGMQDGFGSVLVFGLQCKMRWYRVPSRRKEAEESMKAVMNSMGRKLVLESAPKLAAVYCISITGQPVVLTVRMKEKEFEVFAYSGKGLVGMLSNLHVIKKFEKGMPAAMTPLSEDKIKVRMEAEKEKLKSPRQLKKEKKAAEKKAAKEKKRQAHKEGGGFATVGSLLRKKETKLPAQVVQHENKATGLQTEEPVQEIEPVQEVQPEVKAVEVQKAEPEETIQPVQEIEPVQENKPEIKAVEVQKAEPVQEVQQDIGAAETSEQTQPEPVTKQPETTEKPTPVSQPKKNKKKKKRKH